MPSEIIVVERDLLKSAVFRALNGTSKTVYFDFRMKCKVKSFIPKRGRKAERQILNNGELVYPYSEAEKKGIPRATFMRALDELIGKGFIDIAHSGSGGKKGDVSLYGISDRWRKWGSQNFIEASRPKDTRSGRGITSDNWEARTGRERKANIGFISDNPTVIKNDNPNRKVASLVYRK